MSNMKRAILRAVSIKLEVEAHKKYRKFMAKLLWLVFIGFLGVGLYNSVGRYSEARAILSDVEYVEAEVEELPEYVSKSLTSYRYSFSVDERSFQKDFTASDDRYKEYMGEKGLSVVYKKSDPSHSGIAALVEKDSAIGGVFKYFALLFFLGGLAFMVFNMFLTYGIVQPVVEYEDDED